MTYLKSNLESSHRATFQNCLIRRWQGHTGRTFQFFCSILAQWFMRGPNKCVGYLVPLLRLCQTNFFFSRFSGALKPRNLWSCLSLFYSRRNELFRSVCDLLHRKQFCGSTACDAQLERLRRRRLRGSLMAAFENTTRRVFCLSLLWELHV